MCTRLWIETYNDQILEGDCNINLKFRKDLLKSYVDFFDVLTFRENGSENKASRSIGGKSLSHVLYRHKHGPHRKWHKMNILWLMIIVK